MYYNTNDMTSNKTRKKRVGDQGGRPIIGLSRRLVVSARIEEHIIEMIKDDYGSVQKFIDRIIKEKIKGIKPD